MANTIHCSQASQLWSGSTGFIAASTWTPLFLYRELWPRTVFSLSSKKRFFLPMYPDKIVLHIYIFFFKSRIRETLNFSPCADSRNKAKKSPHNQGLCLQFLLHILVWILNTFFVLVKGSWMLQLRPLANALDRI